MPDRPARPTPRSRRRRRRLYGLFGVGILLLLAALALPWWLPAVVVRVAASQGVVIREWTSHGWSGAEYRRLEFARDGVRVSVAAIRAPVLGLRPRRGTGMATIEVSDVKVVTSATAERPDKPEPSMAGIVRQVDRAWRKLQRWLPATRIDRIVVEADGRSFTAGDFTWDGRDLKSAFGLPWRGIAGTIEVAAPEPGRLHLSVLAPSAEVELRLDIDAPAGDGAAWAGGATWRGHPIELRADFPAAGWLPASARITCPGFSLPSSDVGLEGFGPIEGSVELEWRRDAYTARVVASAEPLPESAWPALAVDVRAAGGLDRVRIDAIDVRLPGMTAALSRPLDFSYDGGGLAEPAEFSVDVDLGAVSAIPAQGRLGGLVAVRPADDGSVAATFKLSGSGLAWRGVEDGRLALEGSWRRPELVIDSAVLEIGAEARSRAAATVDVQARTVRGGIVHAELPRALLQALAPDLPACERVVVDGGFEGPWNDPEHHGRLEIGGLEWTADRSVGCHLEWRGRGRGAALEGAVALAGGGSLPFAVEISRADDGALRATLAQARWEDERGEWWRLMEPVGVTYVPEAREWTVSPWRVAGEGFEASGDAAVRWPAAGRVAFAVHGLEGARLGGVLPEAVRGGRIEDLRLNARWDRGPVVIDGTVRARYSPVAGTEYVVAGEYVSREGGLAFGALQVLDDSGVVLHGAGHLPLTLEGNDDGFSAQLSRDGAMSLDVASEPNAVFWKSIADLTGWTVANPRLSCRLVGSIAAPRGELEVAADTLRPPDFNLGNGGALPELTGLLVRVGADEDGLSITEGMVAIDNRWVTLTGHAPWSVWSRWRESGRVAWREAAFKLASNPLPIAIASRIFPTELAPVGEVSIEIAHDRGAGMSGRIWLHSAALRPIGPLGSVRDIASELDFFGYEVRLTRLEGFLGGQPVRITGSADVNDPERPAYALKVQSSRVPLVRRAGLIVRTEVDLELRQDATGPARVTGRIDFGPSLYSADLLELIPSGVDSPETRPPYFSVEEQPFAAWELDVQAHGEAFLRLTTPFYKDLLSADLRLTGTLGEPRAEGWVWGTGGYVTFPFGGLPVEQVLVTLSRDDPYEPRLLVSGSGRVMGYDIRMEVSGPASEPRLLFTSDPPVTSQQIFLMLTTGAVPDEANTIGTSDRASRLAFFLGRNLAAGLGLGGKGGGDERLNVRSGEDFTREGRETILVQYDLDGRWSIVGEYDRFDAYNGGIKFRIINR